MTHKPHQNQFLVKPDGVGRPLVQPSVALGQGGNYQNNDHNKTCDCLVHESCPDCGTCFVGYDG